MKKPSYLNVVFSALLTVFFIIWNAVAVEHGQLVYSHTLLTCGVVMFATTMVCDLIRDAAIYIVEALKK